MHARRFRRIPHEKRRILLLCFALLMLAATIAALTLTPAPEAEIPKSPNTSVVLYEYGYSSLASVTIRRGSEDPWTAVYSGGDGIDDQAVTILGEDGFTLTGEDSIDFLLGAVCLVAEEVLTDDPAEYADHLADFGLDEPEYEARIVYTDGTDITLRVGDQGPEGTWHYMLISGDDRLFAFSNGSVESLFVNRETLRKVEQPTLHKARIDQITLTGPDGIEAQWTLTGSITDADAVDKWRITAPFAYPADSTAMTTLLSNIANLRLGAYICPATTEALTEYGFDAPRLTIDIHMAAGTIGTTNADGAVETADWPESTVTFVIGGERNDMVDYVLCGDSIYISSHFTMGMFIGYNVRATMSRYPIMTALGNLASLTIVQPDATTEYVLTRTEQVAENNDLVTDEDGNVVYDVTVTRNGEPCSYEAFAASYNAWTLVTVSGVLPEGEVATAVPHTSCIFTDVDGTVHTLELATFDALHDAVIVDGHQAFYLIKGGLFATLPE